MQDDSIETHTSPRYWDSWEVGHTFIITCYFIRMQITVLGPNCVWRVK